jgi:hypothetical protein
MAFALIDQAAGRTISLTSIKSLESKSMMQPIFAKSSFLLDMAPEMSAIIKRHSDYIGTQTYRKLANCNDELRTHLVASGVLNVKNSSKKTLTVNKFPASGNAVMVIRGINLVETMRIASYLVSKTDSYGVLKYDSANVAWLIISLVILPGSQLIIDNAEEKYDIDDINSAKSMILSNDSTWASKVLMEVSSREMMKASVRQTSNQVRVRIDQTSDLLRPRSHHVNLSDRPLLKAAITMLPTILTMHEAEACYILVKSDLLDRKMQDLNPSERRILDMVESKDELLSGTMTMAYTRDVTDTLTWLSSQRFLNTELDPGETKTNILYALSLAKICSSIDPARITLSGRPKSLGEALRHLSTIGLQAGWALSDSLYEQTSMKDLMRISASFRMRSIN